MTIEVIRNLSALQLQKNAWHELWKKHPRPEIFQHYAWTMAFIDAYQCEKRLYVLFLRDQDGVLIGICPWALNAGRITWLTSPRAEYNDVICAREDGARLIEACLRHLRETSGREWREVLLEDVPDDSVWSTCIRSLAHVPVKIAMENGEECMRLRMDAEGSVLRGIVSKKGYSRNEKALASLGSVSLIEHPDIERRLAVLPGFFEQHITRWKAAEQASMFCEQTARRFYELLVQAPELVSMIDFTSLQAGSKTIAYHLGFWGEGKLIGYKWCFDPALQKAGPGTVLMVRLMHHAASRGRLEFDMSRGGENYKGRFTNASHMLYDWRAFSSPRRRLLHGAKAHVRQRYPQLSKRLGALSHGIRTALKKLPFWKTLA